MNWKEWRGRFDARSTDNQIDWLVMPKKNGKYYIKAFLGGGASHRLPFQEFETAQEAKGWAEEYDQRRYEKAAEYAKEEPIRL